jgi:predicted Zn-ribbon and HTH transcriptional regulator
LIYGILMNKIIEPKKAEAIAKIAMESALHSDKVVSKLQKSGMKTFQETRLSGEEFNTRYCSVCGLRLGNSYECPRCKSREFKDPAKYFETR